MSYALHLVAVAFHYLWALIDGSPFDIITLVVAVLFASLKCYRGHHKFMSSAFGFSILNGMAIFPLLMLLLSVFSKEALSSLLTANRLILAGAGAVALFALLEDEFDKPAATT